MLKKIITDFKKSLPESIRNKMDTSKDESSTAGDETKEEGEKEEDSEGEKKAKQKSMLIKVVVILGLAYFALDEFILNKDGKSNTSNIPNTAVTDFKNSKKPKKSLVQVEKKISPVAVIETPSVPSIEKTAEPPVENINVVAKDGPIREEPVKEESVREELVKEESVKEELVKEEPIKLGPIESVVEEKIPDSAFDKKIDHMIDEMDHTDKEKIETPKKDMSDKIVEEAVETQAPPYDQIGRGLVYNCKDKYWACLDKASYIICNKNMKWNKSKGNALECVTKDVYSSEEDCAKIQKYNVSTNQTTDFCQ